MQVRILFSLPALLLLSSCVSQGGSVKAGNLLDAANSSAGRNIVRVVSSNDPKAALQTLAANKRDQWARDPLQLAHDLRQTQRDFKKLMDILSGKVKEKWGKKETRLPERKTYVKYTRQYKSRAIVNFEQGEVVVETLEENADANLRNAIVATLLTPEDPASVDVFSDSAVNLNGSSKPFLLGLVLDDAGREIATPEAAASFADKVLPVARTRKIQIGNGAKPVRYVVIPMVANFEDKKAQKYLQHVRKYARQYNVSPSLILGIMRSESSFNPHAVSPAPAYGLMQLVPASGGREAYRRAKNEDVAPSKDYLFAPENNIELGAAYLNVLLYDQLGGVEDRTARDYCVISAYNTGPGNVMRAFTDAKGQQRFSDGLQRINRLTPPQVFQELRKKLPYAETRNYLPIVNNNRKRYYGVDKTIMAGDTQPAASN